jgi:hypothetical protein
MATKQSGSKRKHYMGHHEEELGCLPKYNYSTGKGYRSHKKGNGVLDYCDCRYTPVGGTSKQGRSVH